MPSHGLRRCLLVGLILAGCSAPASSATPNATAPGPVVSTAPTPSPIPTVEPIHLLVLGDSIGIPSMGCGDCIGFDIRYAKWLESRTGRHAILTNEARPNYRIQDLQGAIDEEVRLQRLVAEADIVVVTIGYNNGPNWDPSDPCHAPEGHTIAESLRITLEYLQPDCVAEQLAIFQAKLDTLYGKIESLVAGRRQVRVSLGVYANLEDNVGLDDDGTIATVSAEELAQAIELNNRIMDDWNVMDCAAATPHGFVCGDIHHAFNGSDGNGSVASLTNPNDSVHPNEAGQAKIAELLEAIDVSAVANP